MVLKTERRWQQVLLVSKSSKAHDSFYADSVEAPQEKYFVLQVHRISTVFLLQKN
jgi:hypothetical protein